MNLKRLSVLVLLCITVSLMGCGDVSTEEYQFNLLKYADWGKQECKEHGQTYLMIHTYDLEVYKVVCYQESPMRFFEYVPD